MILQQAKSLSYHVEYPVGQENSQQQDCRELGELHQDEENHACDHLRMGHSEELEAVSYLADPHRD